jgi:hypothetical protein
VHSYALILKIKKRIQIITITANSTNTDADARSRFDYRKEHESSKLKKTDINYFLLDGSDDKRTLHFTFMHTQHARKTKSMITVPDDRTSYSDCD